MSDQYNLERFVAAQAGSYRMALAEIRRGAKRGHWMWWIFPQIAGLGGSLTASFYAISSLDEAQAYPARPWTTLFGLVLFGAMPPGLSTWVGAPIIVGKGCTSYGESTG